MNKIIIFIVAIFIISISFGLPDEKWSYIQNSEVKLGVITNYGAVIGHFSEISPEINFINYMDAGREIQQSYYGWPDGSWWPHGNWVWNPVQGGSWQGYKPKLLVFSNENNKIYAKSNPRNWAGQELLTNVVMEEWIELTGNVAHIIFKMTYTGPSNGVIRHQELPAVFLDAQYTRLTFYNGPMSWTEGSLTNFQPGGSNGYDHRYEQWSAYVNNSGWGMGVYTPGTTFQTRYWIAGSGNEGSGCSYFAPIQSFAITNNITYQYDVYLAIGMTNEIRDTFDNVRKSNFKYEPMPPLKNPGFESPVLPLNTVTNVVHDWNCGGINRIQRGGGMIEPMAGQVAWYNGGGSYLVQSLLDTKLQPNTTYQLTFDAYTTAASATPRTIHAGIMFGKDNIPYAVIQNTNVENFAMSSGTWIGDFWSGGGRFNTEKGPAANDPSITHTLMFDTPVSNIVGNNLIDDLTVDIWDSSGIQVFVDNVRVTNYPRNRIMQPDVINGTFDSPVIAPDTALDEISNWNNSGCGVINADVVPPLSGQCAYFNSAYGCVQTFPGVKLQPDKIYTITFDSYSMPEWDLRTIKVGLGHARYFGNESRFICPIDDNNVENVNGSGIWLDSEWASGMLFTNVLNPSANDPLISHTFTFSTPEDLTGDHLAFDLGVKLWDAAGPQVKLDNLAVTNFPIPEPALLLIVGILILFLGKIKLKLSQV